MKRCLTTDEEIFINQFSQNLHSLEDINNWFFSYDLENKRDIISNLLNIVIQSHPTYDDIESAAISLNKSRSASAVKLLNRKKPFDKFGYELCDLPEKELLTCFDILMLRLYVLTHAEKNRNYLRLVVIGGIKTYPIKTIYAS